MDDYVAVSDRLIHNQPETFLGEGLLIVCIANKEHNKSLYQYMHCPTRKTSETVWY